MKENMSITSSPSRKIFLKVFPYFECFKRYNSCAKKLVSRDRLLKDVHTSEISKHDKVSIIGLGNVGIATAFTLLNQDISGNLVLVSPEENKLLGETLDLQHGSIFRKNSNVDCCTDYSKTANSRITIITAGAKQKPGEDRLNLLQRNADIMTSIIPKIVKYSPNTILLMVTNPVDILSYVSWKISGLPANKIIGSGTNLDSSRFRFLLSRKLGLATSNVHGFIIGEHGDSSVALWSSVNIAGVRLREVNPAAGTDKDPENWIEIHKKVVGSAYEVIKLKGSTSWAVALSVGSIVRSILRNPIDMHAVSINVKGLYGIQEDIFLSLPCLLDSDGLCKIIKKTLDDDELEKLHRSVEIVLKTQKTLKI